MAIEFFVEGNPVAKERVKKFFNKNTGRMWGYTPRRTVDWENIIRKEALKYIQYKYPKDTPLVATIQVLVAIPKSFSKKKTEQALDDKLRPTTRPDLDNYIKCLDSLNGILFEDDSQVVEFGQGTGKFYSNTPGVNIKIDKIVDNEVKNINNDSLGSVSKNGKLF